jgi:hypothetical protein
LPDGPQVFALRTVVSSSGRDFGMMMRIYGVLDFKEILIPSMICNV